MIARVLIFLIGAAFLISQLMLDSNVTIEAVAVTGALSHTLELTVMLENGSQTVHLTEHKVIAECLQFGNDMSCNCSDGYMWSNTVCYDYTCCSDSTCTKNVSFVTPLCVAKLEVRINGSVQLNEDTWNPTKTGELETEFQKLNGFDNLNVTGTRLGSRIADFEVLVRVGVLTSKLQEIMTTLENKFKAVLLVDTYGMVNIEAPADPVCYHSSPELKCTLEDMSDSSGWNMSRMHASFELAEGSVVKIDKHCAMQKLHSCIAVKLEKVTGMWTGLYECGFTIGSVRHTAKSKLQVALLPDEIILESKPLVADCTKTNQAKVDITATILNSSEPFNVTCSLPGCKHQKKFEVPKDDQIYTSYTFMAPISCKSQKEGHSVNITFTNARGQSKSAKITIPVIYGSEKVCKKETLGEDTWPDTPGDDTVIIRTCPEGRTGYKSRTCIGSTWQPVFYHCVSQELNNNQMAADNFLKGLGATEEVALNIFERLKNSSIAFKSDSSSNTADIDRSISILDSMAKASETIVLQDSVLKDFVESASNMLDNSWTGINESVSYKMSANYLESVESLVKNIEVNQSNGIDSQNLELNFCRSSDCMVSVFDINVSLNKSSGILKTLGVKNLMEKLKNSYGETERTSLLLSATLSGNNDSSVEIRLDFPREDSNYTKPVCVFWNTTFNDWSDKGCSLKTSSDNRSVCVCNHLTAFSVLMSKGDVSDEFLSIITYVGLGVSICSLLIFLLVESLVWSAVVKTGLSLFRHTALVNIAVFLLLGDCCFLATTSPKEISDTMCLALTVCKHLFFLAMFSWMLCMSVMLVHQLIFVFSPLRKRVFMFLSSIVGYVCPVLIVGSSYIYCKYTESDYVDRDKCWLKYERILVGSIHAFLLPVGTVIFTNLFSMVVVIITLLKSNVPDGSKADEKETAKGIIKVVVFLTPVFGLTWIIGFAMLILGENSPLFQVFNYSFTILNSFQGFFLLLTGCFAEPKVRDELCRLLKIKGKGRTESTKNLTSTTYTKDK